MDAKILPYSVRPKPSSLINKSSFFFKTQTSPHTVVVPLRPRSLNAAGPTTNSSNIGSSAEEGSSNTGESKANNSSEKNNVGVGSSSSSRSAVTKTTTQQPRQAPGTLNIRYRSISRKQAREQKQQQQDGGGNSSPPPPGPPKDWEEMTLGEKAVDLYVGEKGLLFWLNKFAYASIFFIIGGWILFRFVGPSLGLYQLDTPPLSPSAILKG